MPETTDDLTKNLDAVRRAAERDPDDAEIAADDAGVTADAEEVGETAPSKP